MRGAPLFPGDSARRACSGPGLTIRLALQVTRWWEEEKTWRDLRPDWRQIKQRLKEEEEDWQREAEEEAAISGPVEAGDAEKRAGAGSPAVGIALEDETREKLAI